ncbi:P27 family phage terminase small subunit [Gemmata sp. JC673]|uniref:P27 family phage terminase small subunit n=1 Tax=Gemmata algarum TaxID=2975278 RepID=A0ABU5ERZ4_9BACT|nr:P27 family phage terminase small subunit [Gemmata algarum]MDY3558111.1 P27 family phage terminase small subunit [Gemmata algarum]
MNPTPEPPVPLTQHARAYWDRHYARLEEAGVITAADAESFALLCVVWGKIQELQALPASAGDFRTPISLDRLLKQYHAYAKQFGLLPQARKQSKMTVTPPKKKDEWDL